jgi:pilus assembly protein Flp/PilA
VHTNLLRLYVKLQNLVIRQEGQDMVEYALVFGLLAFGATAGTHFMASGLAGAFQNLSSTLSGYTA